MSDTTERGFKNSGNVNKINANLPDRRKHGNCRYVRDQNVIL
jgi:hypothetical protein